MKRFFIISALVILLGSLIGCAKENPVESSTQTTTTSSEEVTKATETTEAPETVFVGIVEGYSRGDLTFKARSVSGGEIAIIDASQMSAKAFEQMLYVSNMSTVTVTHKGVMEEDGKNVLLNIVSMDVEIYDIYAAAGITDEDVVRALKNLAHHREVDFSEISDEVRLDAETKKTDEGVTILWKMMNNSAEDVSYTGAYILAGMDTIGGDGKYHNYVDSYSFEEEVFICEAGSEVSGEILLPEGFWIFMDMRFAKPVVMNEKIINVYVDIPAQDR